MEIGNWANYVFNQLVMTIDRIKKLYPESHLLAQANLITEKPEPAMK
jgi:hypothetical protein